MTHWILSLVVLVGVVLYFMTPEERTRLAHALLAGLLRVKDVVGHPGSGEFEETLRTRTRWTIVTVTLLALNAAVFVLIWCGNGALDDPATLVAWGASFGPRTTNGEWWRLVTSMFVHSRLLDLLVSLAALAQAGLLLERLVGRVAFATTYFATGVVASVVKLAAHPVAVHAGAAGALFGVYGLVLAAIVRGLLYRSPATIPLMTLKRLAPVAGVFVLYHAFGVGFDMADRLALVAGFVWGVVLARGVADRKPAVRRLAFATSMMAATIGITAVCAAPFGGVIDVRPELAWVVAVEDRTAGGYQTRVERFRKGWINADALAEFIDRAILPELQAASVRLRGLHRVPPEHQSLVAAARDYVRLRDQSWRLRAKALRRSSMPGLREADRVEWAALDVLWTIRPRTGTL